MYCDVCKKNPATIHYTKIVNGHKEEQHVCQQCAGQLKEPMGFSMGGFPGMGMLPDFSMADFVGGMFYPEGVGQQTGGRQAVCPVCGMTAAEFGQLGRVGCSGCYETFSRELGPLIQRIHGGGSHRGKVPAHGQARLAEQRRIDQLRQQLQEAVHAEQFERAAQLRDEIHTLEQEGDSHAEATD